jgi:hypothetical protein
MELNYEQQQKKKDLELILERSEDFIKGENRLGSFGINQVASKVSEIVKKYGFDYVAEDLSGNTRFVHETFKDFAEEIRFSIGQELEKIDPIWKHRLMLKKISDMTGYEYKQYLELIGK